VLAYSEWLVVAMAVTALVVWCAVALFGVLTRLSRGARGAIPSKEDRRRRRATGPAE
jgi:uncharacterized protein HemY